MTSLIKRLSLCTALSLCLATPALAASQFTLVQAGNGNSANVEQTGNNVASATLNGDGNAVTLKQVGEGNYFAGEAANSTALLQGKNESVTATQIGIKNAIAIAKFEGVGQTATLLQNGHDNFIDITAAGETNTFSATQYGGGNVAYTDVLGTGNSVTYSQISPEATVAGAGNIIGGTSGFSPHDATIRGKNNTVAVAQIGSNVALYDVEGDSNNVAISQNNYPSPLADKNSGEVKIIGSGNTASISQTGIDNVSKILITNASGGVAQSVQSGVNNFSLISQNNGTGNQAMVTQNGTGNTSTVTQTGNSNIAKVTQN